MENNEIYILNPEYNLRRDKNRVFIFNRSSDPVYDDFIGFVHPVYAILLSFFDGKKKLSEVIETLAVLLKKDKSVAANLVSPLLENDKEQYIGYEKCYFSFPKKLLIKKAKNVIPIKYNPGDFLIPKNELEMDSWRLHAPLDILFMVNTICATDCIYCYADRKRKVDCRIPLERLKELIQEARQMDMRSFDISGGEFFLYRHWEELLKELVSNGFMPYISTKCPIDLETVKKIKALGVNKIQISIDSIMKEELVSILNVEESYCGKLLDTFKYLDENDFDIYTNTQITGKNKDNISKLLDFLLDLKSIKRIKLGAAAFSLYKGERNFLKYKAKLEDIKNIETHINDLKSRYEDKVSLSFGGYYDKSGLIDKTTDEKRKNFSERARCSGNFYAFVILPDGKVTICEELYWQSRFIIGDLTRQSIKEVWNSEKALELYRLSRDSDLIKKESACKSCDEFDSCHKQHGVCWKEVIYAYGQDNWDYPDPKCPAAPKPMRQYYF